MMDEQHKQLLRMGYNRIFGEQQLPPTEQLLLELERATGQLPGEYRSFLLEFGSIGPAVPVELPVPSLDENFSVCYFLGFYRADPNPNLLRFDLRHVYNSMRQKVGASMLPIATGEGGSLVCLSLSSGKTKGTIWGWACDIGQEEGWNLFPLADSIGSLIRNLRPFVDPVNNSKEDD